MLIGVRTRAVKHDAGARDNSYFKPLKPSTGGGGGQERVSGSQVNKKRVVFSFPIYTNK